jgi:GntR family transcriptional regulator, rspAB operon transcriptional repressor
MSRRELSKAKQRGRRSASLRDTAHEAIKIRIMTCALKPGEYVNEVQLSEMLGIGRTPVHQALDRLMVEGMVEIIPRKGVVVRPFSLNELLEIIEVRLINECYCARLAAIHASDQDIAELDDVLQRAAHWLSARNVEKLMLADREFHQLVARVARNDVVADLVRSYNDRSLRSWFLSLHQSEHYKSVHQQHQAILAAIRKRDPDRAEAAMRRHLEAFRAHVSQLF